MSEKRYGSGFFKEKPRRWTEEEDQFVRDHIADMTHAEIAEELGRTESSVNSYCSRKNIMTPGGGKFKKGHKTWNKGMKPEEYMDGEALKNLQKNQFKKGQKPHNTKFDGAVTIRKDSGTGRPYMWIRISEGNWKMYHVHVWEQRHGAVPDNKIIVFKDGNSLDPSPDNLECISRAEHARRNQDWRKAMQTMMDQGNHPSKHLTDRFVADILAGHDKELKQYLLDERPDLIKVARANYKLQRKIRDHDGSEEKTTS